VRPRAMEPSSHRGTVRTTNTRSTLRSRPPDTASGNQRSRPVRHGEARSAVRIQPANQRRLQVPEAPVSRAARSLPSSGDTVACSTPVFTPTERLSLEIEYRPQQYERLIKVADRRELRFDRRFIASAAFERPLTKRTTARWTAALETRKSNDPDKRFFAPTFGVTISYRVR
jgi:hypothetical protein